MMMKRWMLVWLMLGGVVFGQVIPPGGGVDVELTAELIAAAGGVTNGGATINGVPITNGAEIMIAGGGGGSGGGSGGGLSNIVVAGVSGTLTGSGSNVLASVSLASLAGAGVATNAGGAGAGYYAMSNGSWRAFAPGAGSAQTVQVYVAQAGTAAVANVALSGWPAQTTQVYVAQAGTAQVAVVATTVTGTQSNTIATALQPASTNGWVVSSHAAFLTAESDPVFATNGVKRSDTNGWTVSSHSGLATNAGGAGAGYYAMSNGAWTAFAPNAGGTANAVTNGGVTINGAPITNGASFTITGGGSGGGLSNIVVAGVAGTLSGSGSNVVASVSLAALAGAGVLTNGPTLQQVVTAGGTASGTVAVATGVSDRFLAGYNAGASGSGNGSAAMGYSAGNAASGNYSVYAGRSAGASASGASATYIGYFAGTSASGANSTYIGYHAGQSASNGDSIYIGPYAGRNAAVPYAAFIDAYTEDPGASYNPTNDSIVIDGGTTNLYLGRPTGTVNLRGSVRGITAAQVGAVSNGGASINGSPITNGASFTITGGSGGGITNAIVTRIVTYDTTNPVIQLGEGTNAWYWTPQTNVALACTFSGPGAGWAGSGMLRLIRAGNSTTWPTNVAWIVNGTRTTNAPTLGNRNAIIVDYFDGMWGLGLLTTNATVVP
jgi:hypothetical protein